MKDKNKYIKKLRRKFKKEKANNYLCLRKSKLDSLNVSLMEAHIQESKAIFDQIISKPLSSDDSSALSMINDLKHSYQALNTALQASQSIIWSWNLRDDKINISTKLMLKLHYDELDVNNYASFIAMISPRDREQVELSIIDSFVSHNILNLECRLISKDGREYWYHLTGQSIRDEQGRFLSMAGSLTNIDDRRQNENIMARMAHYDSLTDIPNRSCFNSTLVDLIERSEYESNQFSLLIIDLNDFKTINDSYGHLAGDDVLMHIANRLKSVIRDSDIAARLGGDEFGMIVHQGKRKNGVDHQKQDIALICERLIESCNEPIAIGGRRLPIKLSIGVAQFPVDALKKDELMHRADVAMYAAKKRKVAGSCYEFYDESLDEAQRRHRCIRDLLERAIETQDLDVVFQPSLDFKKGSYHAGEVLLRWPNGPEDVEVEEIISIAEESDQILRIGEWMIEQTCSFLASLNQQGFEHQLAVNLSAVQFVHQDIYQICYDAIKKYELKPQQLQIEVTESLFLGDINHAIGVLERMAQLGIQIYIDDFGTGYSSLTYLQKLPADWVKIDKSFIKDVATKNDCLRIVESIVHMSHSLGRKVVAEGVESIEQLMLLKSINCDVAQGYYISYPLSSEEYIDWLIFNKSKPSVA